MPYRSVARLDSIVLAAITVLLVLAQSASVGSQEQPWFDRQTEWNGYPQFHFKIADRPAYIVAPKHPAEGTAESNGHHFDHPDPQRVVDFIARHTGVARSNRLELLRRAKRVVFLGDSITYAGQYVAFFDAWLLTQELDSLPVVINVGLPSETVSGLSEDGHAGGRFPRPDLAERLDRVLAATKPNLVFACYGINCAIYQPLDDQRFRRYRQGIENLKKQVESAGAALVMITSPFYDDQRAKNSFSYDSVLDHYAKWLLAKREQGWQVVELHEPMAREVARRRQSDPEFTFQPDAVHPNAEGHWFMARQLFRWFGDDQAAAAKSPETMFAARGISSKVLQTVRQRSNLRRDAYLSAAGHKRPGIKTGLPVPEAEQQAQQLTAKIEELLTEGEGVHPNAEGHIAIAKAVAAHVRRDENTQPNIVLFLVDDMGWQDTSVPFHTEISALNRRYRTPHMQQLATAGMKFTQAYACTVCSPTRVSLMTGLNASRHRVTNWTLRKNASNDRPHPTLTFPEWNVNGLSPRAGIERTVHAQALPAFLRDAGYRTIHVGKAHFGAIGTPGSDPIHVGFDVNIAGHAGGGPGSFLGTQNFRAAWRKGDRVWDVPGLEAYHGKDVFLTEALTIEANRAVDQAVADDEPFFLYMSHYAVHVPFAIDQRFYQPYRDRGLDHTEAMYAAMVEGMDKSLGDILANIHRHGLSDETVVLFMSDNGGLSASSRGGKPHTHNKPLSSGKGSAHEGGVRVPMIVCWPGVTQAGSVCDQPVIIEDFFPSILEMAGVRDMQQIGGEVDGLSFVPLLRSEHDASREMRPLVWHFPNNWGPKGPGIGPSSSIRRGKWKLIYYHEDRRYELFDVVEDLGEQNNLADRQPEVRDRLAAELGQYLESVDAQMPTNRATGEMVPYPGPTE